MLVYQATKREFMDDVDTDTITQRIRTAFEQRLHRANEREVRSWTNSMHYADVRIMPTPSRRALSVAVPVLMRSA